MSASVVVRIVVQITLTIFCVGQEDGTVALLRNGVRNSLYSSGIVQVYYDGSWEGICNDASFGINAADVICHQLGFTGVDTYSTVAEQL